MSEYTDEKMDELRKKVRDIMNKDKLSQADVGRKSGIPNSTFAGWMANTYAGNNDRVALEVEKWLTQRDSAKETVKGRIGVPEFQQTKTSERIIQTLTFAQALPEISVIGAGSGLGKTTTSRHFSLTRPNVWLVTVDPSTKSVASLLREIATAVGIYEQRPGRIKEAVLRRIKGTNGLIIVDEAQYLTTESLDFLRSLYDLSDNSIGLALVGNETISTQLQGGSRKGNYAQLYSRIGMRWSQSKPRSEDINTIVDAWNLTDVEMIKTLQTIGKKPGAIRNVTKVMQLASMLARGRTEELTNKHLHQAYNQLSFSGS